MTECARSRKVKTPGSKMRGVLAHMILRYRRNVIVAQWQTFLFL